jgi:hypothetical protein
MSEGHIIDLGRWDQPYTIDLMVDEKKWLESEKGFLQASVRHNVYGFDILCSKGKQYQSCTIGNGTGLYTHYSLNVDLMKPPFATQRHEWNVWVKETLEYDN